MRPFRRLPSFLLLVTLIWLAPPGMAADWVRSKPGAGDFLLATPEGAAALWYSENDYTAVHRAVRHLAADIERVAGSSPALATDRPAGRVVVVGTLGRHPQIDAWVAEGRLELGDLAGSWESFVITTVANPWPEVEQALVIVGSDRRGTAFGVFELSQAIGVSPWHWWADVPPSRQPVLAVEGGTRRFGPPSVRYRGIFINDEDWGLQPWAANTFEPENDDIGPRTYERIFELLLRLKANTLWPAMHPSTRPFNHFRENPRLADEYGIVMGSSHAEPMLRNNVGEWKAPPADYNYVTHREGVLQYWEERVEANRAYEAIYTLGMRGIHDSHMQGPRTDAERLTTLQQVFRDQRELIARHVDPQVERVPQMFCAYKEVLDLYRQGLDVPDDVTIVWPDDNFGYIRNFAGATERGRSGGYGVYYHASYLGRPLAYLWLNTTPPALIWQEMVKAYEHGADRIWILNVGDLKPAEIATEFFLQLAWDIGRWDEQTLPTFLLEWAEREFGPSHAAEIAELMERYFVLNFQRKPEHLQWWLANETPRPSPLSAGEIEERLRAFVSLRTRAEAISHALPPAQRDAFFQLVLYPVAGAAAANERYFHAEQYARHFNYRLAEARQHAAAARLADERLHDLTEHFNTGVAGGKWRYFMALEPADNQWRSMRIAPLPLPAPGLSARAKPAGAAAPAAADKPPTSPILQIDAGSFTQSHPLPDARWVRVPGLGRSGNAVTVRPATAAPRRSGDLSTAPALDYTLKVPESGSYHLEVQFLPTHPLNPQQAPQVAVRLGDGAPVLITQPRDDGGPTWAQGVLNGTVRATVPVEIATPGAVRLQLLMVDPGVVVDRLFLYQGAPPPSYLGPAAPR